MLDPAAVAVDRVAVDRGPVLEQHLDHFQAALGGRAEERGSSLSVIIPVVDFGALLQKELDDFDAAAVRCLLADCRC